ncbi:MAG TPA: GNAT family N-acetyltransferase [Ktedonobacterales bacterium]|nr:GNAT family N-acetyltransferase [Ktedonobacterales bacterium]
MDDDRPARAMITSARPDTADAMLLIAELEAHLDPRYPPASRHGLSVEQLISQDVAFFVLRWDGAPAGCGGVKMTGDGYGEIKRMYVRPHCRGRGFATMILGHLAEYARARGVGVLRLETGIYQREAIGLYERMGFYRIAPFGDYTADPLSVYLEMRLA